MHQRVVVPCGKGAVNGIAEVYCPVVASGGVAAHGAQVVDDVAAADHQHVLFAQRGEFFRQIEMPLCRLHQVQAELHHGNVGFGIQVFQHRPRAVVEAAFWVHFHVFRLQQRAHLPRQFGRAGRGILHLAECCGEAVKIVNHFGAFAGRYLQTVAVPVRRNHQNGLGLGKFLHDAAEALVERVFRVQRVHRAAVSDKQYGHFVHGFSQFVFRFEADDFTGNFCSNHPVWGRIYFLNEKSLGVFWLLCFIIVV